MTRLVLLNGAPGSGKSTIADLLAASDPVGVSLNLDVIKHSLPQWNSDPISAGLRARDLCLGQARAHLIAGGNVYLGQYLAKPQFIQELEAMSRVIDCQFIEMILILDDDHLSERIRLRAEEPSRPEHEVNARLVSVNDVPKLNASIEAIRALRPAAIIIDANGDITSTLNAAHDHVRSE